MMQRDAWGDFTTSIFMAAMPGDQAAQVRLYTAAELMIASEVAYRRFVEACGALERSVREAGRADASATDAEKPRPHVELFFFLTAAGALQYRLDDWIKAMPDGDAVADAGAAIAKLVTEHKMLKRFRHHQVHLEQRLPGGEHQSQSQLSAPGNHMIEIEGGGSVTSINNLRDGRWLSFGDDELDLAEVHGLIIECRDRLRAWLESISRFRRPRI